MFNEKIPITKEKKIAFNGIFDIREIYNYLKDYLEKSLHYDTTEKELIETNQKGTRKIDSHYEAELQYNDYFKIILKYRLEASGKEITIEHNGKNLTLTQGAISLKTNSYIELDWQNKRSRSPFSKFLDQIYSKYIGKKEVEECARKNSSDVANFIKEFKKLTNIYVK